MTSPISPATSARVALDPTIPSRSRRIFLHADVNSLADRVNYQIAEIVDRRVQLPHAEGGGSPKTLQEVLSHVSSPLSCAYSGKSLFLRF